MDSHFCVPSSSSCSLHLRIHTHPKANSLPALLNPSRITPIGFRTSNYFTCLCYHHLKKPKSLLRKKPFGRRMKKWGYHRLVKSPSEADDRKKGSLVGAIALVIGTNIVSGMLALPQKASPAIRTSSFSLQHLIYK